METSSMGKSLEPGIHFELCWTVTNQKTVPALFPESPEFQAMPKVFATGYLVGFIEWACILAVNPYIDWPSMQTGGDTYKCESFGSNTSRNGVKWGQVHS